MRALLLVHTATTQDSHTHKHTTSHGHSLLVWQACKALSTTECAALCCAVLCRLQTELSDVRSVEIPAMESRHKEAVGKLHSEVARLKHAVKEAEAVAAAAQAEVLAAGTQPTLQGQLHDAVRERER